LFIFIFIYLSRKITGLPKLGISTGPALPSNDFLLQPHPPDALFFSG
jgi:hypothetical protein